MNWDSTAEERETAKIEEMIDFSVNPDSKNAMSAIF